MKVLLAVDHSDASTKAIAFVGQVFGKRAEAPVITLFHVVESLPEFILSRSQNEQEGAAFREVADVWTKQQLQSGQALFDQAQAELESQGIPAASIQQKLVVKDALPDARRVIAARSIIEEMKQGDHDVIVLGRRGASAIETFLGSVAEKVIREANGKTVWIVD